MFTVVAQSLRDMAQHESCHGMTWAHQGVCVPLWYVVVPGCECVCVHACVRVRPSAHGVIELFIRRVCVCVCV